MAKFIKTNQGWDVYCDKQETLYWDGEREIIKGAKSGCIVVSRVDGAVSWRPNSDPNYIHEFGPVMLSQIVAFLLKHSKVG